MSWRTNKRTGKHFPVRAGGGRGKGTLFQEPENRSLAAEVHASSVEDAEESASKLMMDFRRAKTRRHKEEIRRATQEEANRLYVGAHDHNNSAAARKSLARRSEIFGAAAREMGRQLD